MKKNQIILTLCFAISLILPMGLKSQGSGYEIKDFIKIGGEPRWDYLSVDHDSQRLFVSNSTKVHVIDLKTNTVAAVIDGLAGVHGIAVAAVSGKAYISEGGANQVSILDLKSLKVIGKIKVDGKKPDGIYYDPFSKMVYVSNNGSDNMSVIDTKTDKIIATIKLEGAPESAVGDQAGKIYVNLEDKALVEVIDTKSMKAVATWNLAPAATPTGIAMDPASRRLFVGCRSKHGVVIDIDGGAIIASLPIAGGVDAAAFDPGTKQIFFSCRDGVISVAGENSASEFIKLDDIKTETGSKTMTLDTVTHTIYTSAAIENKPSKDAGGKPEKTFGVLVLEKK